jgi:hypothetical protein
MTILPKARPQASRDQVYALITERGVDRSKYPVVIVGVRGYYLDSMGEPGKNDRMIYDDAIFIHSSIHFAAFNANTDPGAFRKGIANLKPGVWQYKLGIHGLSKPKDRQYKALVQAAPVTVIRDQTGPDTGLFGINIHRGGNSTVSSEGCQTICPSQWIEFISGVTAQLEHFGQKVVPYVLIDLQEEKKNGAA